jgi:DNA-binding NarL/FixJ family response regulator
MKVVICDDHALFRDGLRLVLADLDDSPELVDFATVDQLFDHLSADDEIDLVLLDLNLPGSDGMATLRALRASHPTVPVVIVSASEEVADIRSVLAAGAAGFVPKSSPSSILLAALRMVLSGGIYVPPVVLAEQDALAQPDRARDRRDRAYGLTPRQLEVLRLMGKGLTNKDICRVLDLAEGTVKAHVAAVLEILQVSNRTEAVSMMHELKLSGDD